MREHQVSSAATTKQAPRLLNFDDVQRATGFINEVNLEGVDNIDGSKPILLFNAAQPRLITIRWGRTTIGSPMPAILPVEVISETSAMNIRDLLMIDGGMHQILRSILSPLARLAVQRKNETVELTLTISDFRHTFVMELSEIPELKIVH